MRTSQHQDRGQSADPALSDTLGTVPSSVWVGGCVCVCVCACVLNVMIG